LNDHYYAGPQRQTDSGAVAALVVGVVGHALLMVGLILGPIAIFMGSAAKKRILTSGGALDGAGLAQAGFILGITATILGVFGPLILFGDLLST